MPFWTPVRAGCGGRMYIHRTNNGKRILQFTCAAYSAIPVGKLFEHLAAENIQALERMEKMSIYKSK